MEMTLEQKKALARARARVTINGMSGNAETQQPSEMPWSAVPGQALQNAPASAMQFGQDMIEPIKHPLQTVDNLGAAMSGGLGHLWNAVTPESMNMTPGHDMNLASGIAQLYKDRYGSMAGVKNTLATDPVGAAGDLSTVLTGGAAGLMKLGLPAKAVTTAAKLTNPLTYAERTAKLLDRGAGATAKAAFGASTGTGSGTIGEAVNAGRMGGQHSRAFRDNLRDKTGQADVLDQAHTALGNIAHGRSAAYTKDMTAIKAATTKIPFKPIIDHFMDLGKSLYQNGMRVASDQTMAKMKQVGTVLKEWKANPDAHTAGGLDALKRRIDSLMPASISEDAKNTERVVTSMRNAVKQIIVNNAPDYARVMKNYEESISAQREIERSLSLGKNNTADSALRKLQSITRNNASTNYGSRVKNAQVLADAGAPYLMPALAGQALSSWLPRGLMGALATAGGLGGIATGQILNPAVWGALAATSPRLIGEAAQLTGSARRMINKIPVPDRRSLLLSRGLGSALPPR